jgi:tripartite-type tricarboxylate transporter receptor subunit TctC
MHNREQRAPRIQLRPGHMSNEASRWGRSRRPTAASANPLLNEMKRLACIAALAIGMAPSASAQIYPSGPVTLMVSPLAGKMAEELGHIFADRMTKTLGQPVTVQRIRGGDQPGYSPEPIPAPNGYALDIGNLTSHRYTLYGRAYDFTSRYAPVAQLASTPALLVGRKDLPATGFGDLINWLGQNSYKALPGGFGPAAPRTASAGIVGSGTPGHICAIQLQNAAGSRMQTVPYWSEASMLQGLARGMIDLVCGPATNSRTLVRGGEIKAYAVMAADRWFMMPSIPTVEEMGFPRLYSSDWYALWAPVGTPRDIVTRLNASVVDASADPEVRRRIADLGMALPPADQMGPEALQVFQRAEIERWCNVMVGPGSSYVAVLPPCGGRRADALDHNHEIK